MKDAELIEARTYLNQLEADISIDTTKMTVDQAANIIVKMILKNPRSIKDL